MALYLNPRNPGKVDRKRDQMIVNAWIYSVNIYLRLIEVGAQNVIAESDKKSYAANLFSGTAVSWWFLRVQSNQIPTKRRTHSWM